MLSRSRQVLVVLLFAMSLAWPAATQAQSLDVVGQSNLGGAGLNGQVATVDNLAIVASGVLGGAGARSGYYVTYPCPAGTVKIVDVANPSSPTLLSEIPIQRHAIASDVAALRVNTPTFSGVLLAVALVRCSNTPEGNATERGVAYYNISDPRNPQFISRFNPDENAFLPSDPVCSLANSNRCASSNDNVTLVQRSDGRVLSLSTEPFSSNSQTNALGQPANVRPGCGTPGTATACPYRGDVRIVEVTNPTTPTFVGSYPNAAYLNNNVEQRPPGYTPPGGTQQPISTSNNGCRNFNAALSVGVKDANTALVPYLDAGLLTSNITDPARPVTLGRWSYPTDRALEANGAYVDPATVGGRDLALMGENDWIGVQSSLRIDNGSVAGSKFACEASFTLFDPQNTAQVYRKPGGQIPGQIVYVGRACPGDAIAGSETQLRTLVNGKIAFRDRARTPNREPAAVTNCTTGAVVKRLQDAGALGVVMGNSSTTAPQAVTIDGDPNEGASDLTIPVTMIDTGDGDALRNALCPVVPGTPSPGGCGPGGETLNGAMVDSAGEWGALRVLDVTDPANPTLRGTYRPPLGTAFPPPDLGVYSVHHAVARGSTGFVAAHANGLRAIDLTSPNPTEIASFVPADSPDPTASIPGEANVVGVDVAENGAIVASDVNSGLYVLRLRSAPDPTPPPPPPAADATPPPPPPAAAPPAPTTPVRGRGRLSARVTPTSDLRPVFRFTTSGRLTLPRGVSAAVGCRGRVSVQVKRGGATISTRRVSLRRNCTYSLRVSFANRRRFGRSTSLRFTARFLGNARVAPATAPARFARVRPARRGAGSVRG